MLQFQVGQLKSQGGQLVMEMQCPPQPISMLDSSQRSGDSKADPFTTASKSKKRKAETGEKITGKTEPLKAQILLPSTNTNGVIYNTDGTTAIVDGPFTSRKLKTVLGCTFYQMVPCTVDEMKDIFELWMNEDGQYENDLNTKATNCFGKQVYGGELYGNVLVVKSGAVD